MIEIVSPALVDRVWPRLQEGLTRACQKGGNQFSEAWLHLACRKGDAYLCLMHDGGDLDPIKTAVIVQEQQWLDRQVLYVLATTGHDAEGWWGPMVEWAKLTFPGCRHFVFEGRPGWVKLPGVRVLRHVYEMDMNNGQQER